MSNHSIVLSSSLCRDSFPHNHGGEFSNYLNQSLEFDDPDESWTVALSEIFYQPDSWENIRDGYNECKVSLYNFGYIVQPQKVKERLDYIYYDRVVIKEHRLFDRKTKLPHFEENDPRFAIDDTVLGSDGEKYYVDRSVGFELAFFTNNKECFKYQYYTHQYNMDIGRGGLISTGEYDTDWRWPTEDEISKLGDEAPRTLKITKDEF